MVAMRALTDSAVALDSAEAPSVSTSSTKGFLLWGTFFSSMRFLSLASWKALRWSIT